MSRSIKASLLAIVAVVVSSVLAAPLSDATPGVPELTSPPDGWRCMSENVVLDWEVVAGARCYQVQLGTACGEGVTFATLNSARQFLDVDRGVQHFWRVRARFEEWGPWSECWSFGPSLDGPPGTPLPVSPPNGEAGLPTDATLEWECAEGAASYDLRIGWSCGSGATYSTTSCSKTVTGLQQGRKYWWRVRSRDVCGVPGDWSACRAFTTEGYVLNSAGKWSLHFAGQHNAKANTGDFDIVKCEDLVVDGPDSPGRYDVYVVAADVDRIAGTRYGLGCDGTFFFYGWSSASDLEIPTSGWPGCGEGNAQVWSQEQDGAFVTLGVLDIYTYGSPDRLSAAVDPRVGFGEWCDGTEPSPICLQQTAVDAFGSVGFGTPGLNPCLPTPALLSGFSAKSTEEGIMLEWTASDAGDFSHFFVHRCIGSSDRDFIRLSAEPILCAGGWERGYSYLDEDVTPGTLYYYKLEGVGHAGISVFFGPYGAEALAQNAQWRVSQNVPNPFRRGAATTIHYVVAKAGNVRVSILDAAGRLVTTISDAALPGDNSVTWDGTDHSGKQVSSGVYFYRIQAEGFRAQRKMLMVD